MDPVEVLSFWPGGSSSPWVSTAITNCFALSCDARIFATVWIALWTFWGARIAGRAGRVEFFCDWGVLILSWLFWRFTDLCWTSERKTWQCSTCLSKKDIKAQQHFDHCCRHMLLMWKQTPCQYQLVSKSTWTVLQVQRVPFLALWHLPLIVVICRLNWREHIKTWSCDVLEFCRTGWQDHILSVIPVVVLRIDWVLFSWNVLWWPCKSWFWGKRFVCILWCLILASTTRKTSWSLCQAYLVNN